MVPGLETSASAPFIKVWDVFVRVTHWTLAMTIALAWLSTLSLGLTALHEPAGYMAVTLVLGRLVWGLSGSPYARFSQFLRSPSTVWRYVQDICLGNEPHYLGHNPLGGWMVIALLSNIALCGFTGWLFTTDRFWGIDWLQMLHESLAWSLLLLIALHIIGVIFTSVRHRENLIRAMFSGKKPSL